MKNKKTSWVFFALATIFFWFGWAALWLDISTGRAGHASLLAVLFFLALIFLSLFVILTKSRKAIAILLACCVSGSVALGFSHWLLIFLLIVFCWLLLLWAAKKIKDDQSERISINVYLSLRRGISIFGLALSILISGGFYFSLVEKQEASKVVVFEIKIPQKVTDRVIGLLGFFAPDQNFELISGGASVDEYIRKVFADQSNQSAGASLLKEYSNGETDRNLVLEEGRRMLSTQFGVELSGEEKMNEVVNVMLNRRANEIFRGQVSDTPLLPFGAAVALFIAVSSIFWLLGFLVLWTSVTLFYILLKLQFIATSKETKEVETVDV